MNGLSKWIWARNDYKPDEFADFSDTFVYNGGKAELKIASGSEYSAYINGTLAAFGQFPDYPDHRIYDTVDVTEFLKNGENELTVTAWHFGEDFSTHIKRPAGVRFELCVDGAPVLFSSEDTKARINPYYISHKCERITGQLGFTYKYNARANETPYCPAVLSECQPEVYPRPIKKLLLLDRVPFKTVEGGTFTLNGGERASSRMQAATLFFVSDGNELSFNGEGDGVYLIVDCLEERTGFLEFDIELERDCNVDIGWGEHLTDGRCRTAVRNFGIEYKGKAGKNCFVSPLRRFGGRYIQIFVYGSGAKINYLGFRPTPYPIAEKPFEAGNELRNRIYNTCVNTLRHCMHEHYEDCPWREQALYVLDSRNQMLCGYYVFEETDFAKASLDLISRGMRYDGILTLCYPSGQVIAIPTFSLVFFIQMREYLEYTGDREFVLERLPVLRKIMSTFLSKDRENGLIENFYGEGGYWNFYEWEHTLEGRFNETERSIEAPLNALLSIALENLALICDAFEFDSEAENYRKEKTRINEALRKTFYKEETGLFESFLGRHEGVYSVLNNSLCLLCGAADGLDKTNIIKILKDNGPADTSFTVVPNTLSMNSFRFDALLSDSKSHGADILKEIDREYKKMLDKGATTFWETAKGEADFKGAGSLCHGWSAIPAYYYHIITD